MSETNDTKGTDVGPSTGDAETFDLSEMSVDLDRSEGILEGDTDGTATPPTIVTKTGSGFGARIVGLVAMLLGLLGCVLAFALLAVSLRLTFSASGIADAAASPLSDAVARLETRIDQADDLIDRDGVSGTQYSELQARADGLADTAAAADQAFAAIDDHVLYRWLPVEKDELSSRLNGFSQGASEVAGAVSGGQISSTAAQAAGERLNEMQTSVSSVDDLIVTTVDSLTSWIRLAGLGGLLLSLWNLWAQVSLTKRGWRGLRGR